MPNFSTYYELHVLPTSNLEHFSDFLLSLGIEGLEECDNALIVRSEENLHVVQWGVEEFAKRLSSALKISIDVKTKLSQKSNKDWINLYRKSIKPIEIGSFYIHPSWEKDKDKLKNIIIDPALSFGSGHHESTYSSILSLEKYLKKDDKVLDVGCGSGILSIVSAKLDTNVDSCDTDEQAIISTKENAKLNHVNLSNIWIGSVDKTDKIYDVVVANIIADVLIILSNDLKKVLKNDGILILSGILDKYENRIMECFKDCIYCETIAKNDWRTIIFKKR